MKEGKIRLSIWKNLMFPEVRVRELSAAKTAAGYGRRLCAVLLFALLTLLYSCFGVSFSLQGAALEPRLQMRCYHLYEISAFLGYLSYACVLGRLTVRHRRIVIAGLAILLETALLSAGILSGFGIAGQQIPILFPLFGSAANAGSAAVLPSCACLYMTGIFIGSGFHKGAMLLKNDPHLGKSIGFGLLLSSSLQFLLLSGDTVQNRLLLTAGVILPVLLILLLWEPEAVPAKGSMTGTEGDTTPSAPAVSRWLPPWLMTVCFIFLLAYYDRHMGQLSYESAFREYNIFSWPRLFAGVGAVAAGFAADWRKGKLLPLFTVLVSFVMILNVILFRVTTASVYLMNMSLFYFFLGIVVLFYNHSFWKIAGESEKPFFWAVQGRSIEQAVTVGASLLLAGLTEEAVVALDLAAVALCVVMAFYWITLDMDKTYFKEVEAGITGQAPTGALPAGMPLTEEERRKRFCEKYGLTERESEVISLLLTSEESGQEMAEKLFISRRMLQRHIASIYEKTGVKTRTGLISQYYRESLHDASEK